MGRMLLLLLVVLGTIGCGDDSGGAPDAAPDSPPVDAWLVPVFRNQVTLSDTDLAVKSLQILGADVSNTTQNSCNGCHGVTKQKLRYWRALSDTSITSCLTDLAPTDPQVARTMIDCIREMPTLPTSDYRAKNLGIYTTAVQLPWFEYVFHLAYGETYQQELATFSNAVGMPKEGIPALSQAQFDLVAEWYARGLPGLDQTLITDPAPSTCEDGISADVATHVTAMKTTGWRAQAKMMGMAMHGCGAATDPKLCLQDYPLASTLPYGTNWDVTGTGHVRVLKDVDYVSSYWTRSSPDGRFVGHGVSTIQGSYIVDLQRDALITVDAAYDPAFFPDNSGFMFQGGPRNTCPISVLTANPTAVAMTETGCRRLNEVGLYQHIGQGLGAGADYWALDNEFESDDGGKSPTRRDPDASFSSRATSDFTAMRFTGSGYEVKGTAEVATPFEGDTVLSHSAKLTVGRVANEQENQLGYVLRKVVTTPAGSGFTVQTPEIARYCMSGGKPGFSFDERWIAFHHYVGAADAVEMGYTSSSDPAFADYLTKGAANIYLLELTTGVKKRITNMAPGQYALFPHFRADNWIYAQVRDRNANREYTIASDAALILE